MSIETLLLIIIAIIVVVAVLNWYMQYSTTHAKKYREQAKTLGAKEYAVFKAIYGLPVPMNTELVLFVCDNRFVLYRPSKDNITIKFSKVHNVAFANMNTNFRAVRGLTRENADMIKHVMHTDSMYLVIIYEEKNKEQTVILDGSECDRFVRKLAREYGNRDESIENIVQ